MYITIGKLITNKKEKQRKLDIELNKLESMSLFASPANYGFTPGEYSTVTPRELMLLPFLLWYCLGEQRERSLTTEACQSH